jgi:RPA family protein
MAEIRKRETAYKLKIGDILNGTPIVEDVLQEVAPDPTQALATSSTKEKFRFLELGDKKIIRINVIANIIDKYVSEGERRYATVTIDDASGQIRIKVFGEDVSMLEDISQGDTIAVIGVLRSYNRDIYILPEIIKKVDPRYLLVRKLELEGKGAIKKQEVKTEQTGQPQILDTRDLIIELIKTGADMGGVSTEEIILKIKSASPEVINSEIIKLLEDGMIYEPRPGKVRWLG